MNIFKKLTDEAKEADNLIKEISTPTPTPEPEEEWVWVEGYKGTDFVMRCNGYQYELGVQHNIPGDQQVIECENGFHLCLKLCDVFDYYPIGCNRRFFKVKALVRKSDKDRYGTYKKYTDLYGYTTTGSRYDKLVSKSIIFESELSVDEILKGITTIEGLPAKYKQLAIATDVDYAADTYRADTLINDGYSEPFACYIVKHKLFDVAHAFGSQKDLSMDMKVLGILYKT